jgi:hypothetical protein
VQLETIEQNNQILNNLGSLDGKMDSVSSRVDSVGFGVQSVQEKVQDILEQQDSHNKKVRVLACIRNIAIGSDRKASWIELRFLKFRLRLLGDKVCRSRACLSALPGGRTRQSGSSANQSLETPCCQCTPTVSLYL